MGPRPFNQFNEGRRGPQSSLRPNEGRRGSQDRSGLGQRNPSRSPHHERRSSSKSSDRSHATRQQSPRGGNQEQVRERKSRWEKDNRIEKLSILNPGCNDQPLDFNKPRPQMSMQQAVRQDMERTKKILESGAGQVNIPLREAGGKPSEALLPVEFGKNAAKKKQGDLVREASDGAEKLYKIFIHVHVLLKK